MRVDKLVILYLPATVVGRASTLTSPSLPRLCKVATLGKVRNRFSPSSKIQPYQQAFVGMLYAKIMLQKSSNDFGDHPRCFRL